MRPLVVLLLVLGSLAALLFALTTLDSGGRGDEGRGVVVTPPTAVPERGPSDLVDPGRTVTPPQPAAASEATRQALQPDLTRVGAKVAFGAIHGSVVDGEDNPIAEARISLINTRPSSLGEDAYLLKGSEPPRPTAKFVTEAGGDFRFEQLDPRKDWMLVVTHDRYRRWESELVIPVPDGGVWNEKVVLSPGQTCSGIVRDARTKQPVAGAVLVVDGGWAASMRKKSPSRMEATTGPDGAYAFYNVSASPTQPKQLTLSAPGYATQVHSNFSMVVLGDQPTRFKNVQGQAQFESRVQDFELEPGLVIAGKVVGPERRGLAGIEVDAITQSGTVGSQGFAKSNASGEFLIEGLAAGYYTLRVTSAVYSADPKQRVEAGDTNVQIELFELGTVTGRVLDPAGQPLANFSVKARQANQVSPALGAVMAHAPVKGSKDGRFELRGVPEGSYVIEASAPGYAACFSDPFTATQGLVTSDIVVRMNHGGSLSGIVLDDSRAPLGGIEVSSVDNDMIEGDLWELFSALEPSAMTKTKVFTDANGRFSIEVMTPGLYQIQFKGKGYSPTFVNEVRVVAGQETEMPPMVLSKGAFLTGLVRGGNREVLPGASVQLTPSDTNQLHGHRQIRADAAGRYSFENVQPGTYKLSATRPSTGSGNPFEAIGDMRQSEIEISIEDGMRYEFDLRMGAVGG